MQTIRATFRKLLSDYVDALESGQTAAFAIAEDKLHTFIENLERQVIDAEVVQKLVSELGQETARQTNRIAELELKILNIRKIVDK